MPLKVYAKTFAKLLQEGSIKKNVDMLCMGIKEAEGVKHFTNTYLALRISYLNHREYMIPPFNHNNVLPPFQGNNPANIYKQSPYQCSIMEFCKHFAMSDKRKIILKGFVQFRLKCCHIGITKGFQWIDGSFIEDIMASDNREPNDIDVVSFIFGLQAIPNLIIEIKKNFREFVEPQLSKTNYHVDHYLVEADFNPITTIQAVKYWNQLFGHNLKGIWKGMVEIPFYPTPVNDTDALNYLNSL